MKTFIRYIILFFPVFFFAQINEFEQDSTYILMEGDSIAQPIVNLPTVVILNKLTFKDLEARRRYLILKRKTIKVYPYAKLAADRLDSMTKRLASLKRNRDKRIYTKRIQKYIEGEFSDELKKLSRTEGQILVKLIHRQTGTTAFNLVKELRSGWRAFWYNTTASMFDISLKREFDPYNVQEDYLIEDILQRSFQNGTLQRQPSAVKYNFYDLNDKWLYKKNTD
ncbi:DUF4294 domain-containing protein [Siansivirga zeaxanthinifaciens]|uniref:DUF4294 domain-containing protein n=1 Tax=Siansivirga zeaxanthinifaciens CC-SAMT-1 TaxID=1454006 RepID=A0A0C5WCB0_9FLAO|nr:DUF4294 domain-containing protein [Siansivirga zeaxanthinifaciens]AJR03952.1 hypothetical protein AW14_10250 [Siansivirga zeaxanthinifaciens CC-SAMT-1]